MELLFETREEILGVVGRLYYQQEAAKIHPEPVLVPSCRFDSFGAYIGTVLKEGGRFRMWYGPVSVDRELNRLGLVGYAESEDGISWKKPELKHVDEGPESENMIRGIGTQIFVDPEAPPTHRYRSTAYLKWGPAQTSAPAGYYTAHSPDGFSWEMDAARPAWRGSDVIQSAYHPKRKRGLVTLKRIVRVRGVGRRAFWTAELKDGEWTDARCALVPDDFDDVCAVSRGFASSDYYGFGLMPAGQGTVGLVSRFWHLLPRTNPAREIGLYGPADICLVFQPGPGDAWLHPGGRKDFLLHTEAAWMSGGIWQAASVLDVGDETRIYFYASHRPHNWHRDRNNKDIEGLREFVRDEGGWVRSGFASFARDRIFGFLADPEGILYLDLGEVREPSELILNYVTGPNGSIKIGLESGEILKRGTVTISGKALEDFVPISGNSKGKEARWRGGSVIHSSGGKRVKAEIRLSFATLYAYEVRPVRG